MRMPFSRPIVPRASNPQREPRLMSAATVSSIVDRGSRCRSFDGKRRESASVSVSGRRKRMHICTMKVTLPYA